MQERCLHGEGARHLVVRAVQAEEAEERLLQVVGPKKSAKQQRDGQMQSVYGDAEARSRSYGAEDSITDSAACVRRRGRERECGDTRSS